MRTIIIGGGIGGLAAAYRMRCMAQQRGLDLDTTLLEAGDRWGGVIESRHCDGMQMELGPDAVITAKPAALALIRELGLDAQMQGIDPAARRALIAKGTRLEPVPDGLYLLAPGKLWPFALSRTVSWMGKLRMAADLLLPRRAAGMPEESLGQFVRRRLGREALERIAQPLVSGIYSADPEQLSLAATMPQFLEMEREHRSLILALRARGRAAAAETSGGPRYGLFVTLKGGLQGLVDTLVERLAPDDLRLQSPVVALRRSPDGWQVELGGGERIEGQAIVLALPAHAAAQLLREMAPELSSELKRIPYASIATVNLGFASEQIPALPQAAGFVVPTIENRSLLACTFSSTKFAGRVPSGQVLLRACLGGAQRGSDLAGDDTALVAAVMKDLRDLLGVRGDPRTVVVRRWQRALPQYLVGHGERVARIRDLERGIENLALVGNGYEGTGIPDVIASAETAVARLLSSVPQSLAVQG